jgi:transcriptional regulator with XRE-family HTH domain
MENIAERIGRRIRKLRDQKNLTLRDLSMTSGVSVSMLSKIENSQTFPPISTYARIAAALDVPIGEVITDADHRETISIVRSNERPVITRGSYAGSPLAFRKDNKKMEPFLFSYPFTEDFPHLYQHETEEMIFVLAGRMEFKYGEKKVVLRKGDCAYFSGHVPHAGRAMDRQGATAIVIQSSK